MDTICSANLWNKVWNKEFFLLFIHPTGRQQHYRISSMNPTDLSSLNPTVNPLPSLPWGTFRFSDGKKQPLTSGSRL